MDMNIYAYKCKKCGQVHYPYKTICSNCKENDHNEFDIVPMSKTGKLVTYTHLYTLPADYETVTLTLGIVELEDGLKMTAQLDIKDPKIGMKVRGKVGTVRKASYENHLGMIFEEA